MRKFSLCLIAIAAFLQGCSSNPLSTTGEAIYDALEANIQLRTWADQCEALSPELKRTALLTKKNWWQRNSAFVEAADFGLSYELIHVFDTRTDESARLAMAVTWNLVLEAETTVKQALAKGHQVKVCEQALKDYELGKFDLGGKSKWHQELVELQQRKQTNGEDLAIKQASVAAATGKEYGRSFYVVEKLVKRHGCEAKNVQLIKNRWPDEVYDARCDDKSYMLMRCEWANCRVVE